MGSREIELGQGGQLVGSHAFDVGQARARPVKDLRFFLGATKDGAEPIVIIAHAFAGRGQNGLFRAFELFRGYSVGGEIGGEGEDDLRDFLGLGGFDGDLRGEEAVAGIIFARGAAGGGTVGATDFFADFDAEAVAEDVG